uniref:Mini-chromosome maintenance complex-binding protein n=1 Tax=Fundulus heteroclitus TaxID=8078 RepID=A0A3Q2QPJ6_FUNHE
MPSTHDWINEPLGVVEGMFGNSGWEAKAVEFFREQLKEKEAQTRVPSLNDVPLHYLKPNSLVKFRCLIQDMFDPEFYMGAYETVDPSTKTLRCGKYKDVTPAIEVAQVETLRGFRCLMEKGLQLLWLLFPAFVILNLSAAASQSTTDQHGNGDCKRQETEAPSIQAASASHLDLNFPLPGEKGPSCLVKVYEDWDSFKLNDTLEVYGILSVSPALSALADEKDAFLDPTENMETVEEQRVHSPPASLVPRLHMLYAKRLAHNNPLLPYGGLEESRAFLSSTLGEMAAVRAELLSYFTHVLLGDALAAEYLLLHLISTVYARRDVLPLGKLALNLSGCPAVSSYTERLYQIIQQLVPSSYYLAMTLQNMNQMRLVPKKDYVANRLVSGALQLAKNTSLFLDETQLEQGQLDTTGVRNVTALGNLISWQKVDYDFNFHQMEFPSNVNVLIASEGRSLLPSDCHIHLQPQVAPSHMEEYVGSLHIHSQASSQLNKFRVFLGVARLLDYSISEEVTKAVEDDFVDMRKDDPQSMSADTLHRMLVVARLLSLSLGQTSLSRDSWLRARHIETLRRSRMEQHKSVNGNEP